MWSPDKMNIVVPGRGVVNLDAERVNRAVQEYDERLRFGFNEVNGDWVVYIKMPRGFDAAYYIEGEPVYPVLGFQKRIPPVDEALGRIRLSDSWREGSRIYDRMVKAQERARAAQEAEAADLTGDVAERIEHEMRKQGHTEKYTKVHFNSKE
jgi:hypothetical protein